MPIQVADITALMIAQDRPPSPWGRRGDRGLGGGLEGTGCGRQGVSTTTSNRQFNATASRVDRRIYESATSVAASRAWGCRSFRNEADWWKVELNQSRPGAV
jgi:hypothetical protein